MLSSVPHHRFIAGNLEPAASCSVSARRNIPAERRPGKRGFSSGAHQVFAHTDLVRGGWLLIEPTTTGQRLMVGMRKNLTRTFEETPNANSAQWRDNNEGRS